MHITDETTQPYAKREREREKFFNNNGIVTIKDDIEVNSKRGPRKQKPLFLVIFNGYFPDSFTCSLHVVFEI